MGRREALVAEKAHINTHFYLFSLATFMPFRKKGA
jgi:hypothetical protein